MKKQTIVNFEGEEVRVLSVSTEKGALSVVDQTTALPDHEFDRFLLTENTKEYTVVASFPDFYGEVIHIPPAPPKLIRTVIEKEIKKNSHLTDFSFAFSEISEKIADQRKAKELFVYAVDNKYIKEIILRFTSKGKAVKAIYPDIFAAAALTGWSNNTALNVLWSGKYKYLFLARAKKVLFVRAVQSVSSDIDTNDLQNIKMTLNYCIQSLKISPDNVVLLGALSKGAAEEFKTFVPLSCFFNPSINLLAQKNLLNTEYFSAAAALFVQHEPVSDFLPKADKQVFIAEKALRLLMMLFIAATAAMLIQCAMLALNIQELKTQMEMVRGNLPDLMMISEKHRIKSKEFETYKPYFNALKQYSNRPDYYSLMPNLTTVFYDNVTIDRISFTPPHRVGRPGRRHPPQTGTELYVDGVIRGDSLEVIQSTHNALMEEIKLAYHISDMDSDIDLNSGRFNIKAVVQ